MSRVYFTFFSVFRLFIGVIGGFSADLESKGYQLFFFTWLLA